MFKYSIDETELLLNSSKTKGLNHKQAKERLSRDGENILIQAKSISFFQLFIEQCKDPMVFILFLGAVLSLVMKEIIDAFIILLVVFMNALIGSMQVLKSEKALQALKDMIKPTCKVIRNGKLELIETKNLVVGDLVEIEAGDHVPCDIRLIQTSHLCADESLLTGESEPSEKNEYFIGTESTLINEQKNMIFMSTYITSGRARGFCVATSMNSEVGKIAALLDHEQQEMTPLQIKMAALGKYLGYLAIFICLIMFIVGVRQGRSILEMLLLAISLAVAAIPEGLLAVVTIVQSFGVRLMATKQAIVRKLHALDSLGCVSVICSDKTGTLTQNKMKVVSTYSNFKFDQIDRKMIQAMGLCHNVSLEKIELAGSASEKALVEYAMTYQNIAELMCEYIKIDEIGFDSIRKKMTTIHQHHHQKIAYTKGSLDSILPYCTSIYHDNKEIPLNDYEQKCIRQAASIMEKQALRVFAFSMKQHTTGSSEQNQIFIGLAGLMDPLKQEAFEALQICQKAHIDVVMITGDSIQTAYAIGRQLGLVVQSEDVIGGIQLDQYNEAELVNLIKKTKIYARVTPAHKVKIIQAYKKNNHIVAMSGDGVNDAPALKCADIGVAMGSGSNVAQNASDIILLDNNLLTLVKAIESGRNIYLKIQKSIYYLLSCNIGEVMTLFLGILLNMPAPLKAIQILWINLITDALPALALGVEPDDPSIMNQKPRNKKEGLFAHGGISFILCNGAYIGTVSLVAYKIGYSDSYIKATTMAFMVLSLSQMFHALNCRNITKSLFYNHLLSNLWLLLVVGSGILLQIMVCHIPLLQNLLKTTSLSLMEWFIVFGLAISIVIINEISKMFNE